MFPHFGGLITLPKLHAILKRIIVSSAMKPLPTPPIAGETEFERFDNAVRQVLTVSKNELLRREAREKSEHETVKKPKKS
jgi:hypothetical protein